MGILLSTTMNKILPIILPLQLTLQANLLEFINVNLMQHR